MYGYKWSWLTVVELSIVSKSDIFGPIDWFSYIIINLESFEMAMLVD